MPVGIGGKWQQREVDKAPLDRTEHEDATPNLHTTTANAELGSLLKSQAPTTWRRPLSSLSSEKLKI